MQSPTGDVTLGPRTRRLTPREREIALLIADGYKDLVIARRLSVSPATVATHVQRIQFRLRLSGRNQIAAWVRNHAVASHPDVFSSRYSD
jgi:DNA-binding CsgD family transcriptional regulator